MTLNLPTFSDKSPIYIPPTPASSLTSGMQFVEQAVDQFLAQHLLERAKLVAPDGTLTSRQVNARAIKPALITRFADDMIDGRWRRTHQAIAIGPDGEAIDGQHRLLAVLQAFLRNPNQQPIKMTICYNADPATFAVVDSGRSRNVGDVLGIEHFTHASRLGHAARLLHCYLVTRPGAETDAASARIPREPNKWARIAVTSERLRDVVVENYGMTDDLDHTIAVTRGSNLSAGALIVARYLLTYQKDSEGNLCGDPEEVYNWLEILRTGEGHPYPRHPAFKLRDWSLKARKRTSASRAALLLAKGPLHLRLLIAYWNHSVAGRQIDGNVYYQVDGLVPPIMAGVPAQEPQVKETKPIAA